MLLYNIFLYLKYTIEPFYLPLYLHYLLYQNKLYTMKQTKKYFSLELALNASFSP